MNWARGALSSFSGVRLHHPPLMDVGETVVLVGDVDGMPAGKEGMVMRVRDDMLLIGFRSAERLEFVLARSWEVLPERKWRRLRERERVDQQQGIT